jgi:HSP20 family protein
MEVGTMFFPRNDPLWVDIIRMQQEMDALISEFWGSGEMAPRLAPAGKQPLLDQKQRPGNGAQPAAQTTAMQSYRRPIMDLYETDKEIVSAIELPGVTKDDIKVNATDEGIEVKVEKKAEKKEGDPKKGFYRMERCYSGFYRYVPMPKNADLSKLDASYKEGILELRVPKLELKPAKREIKVN